MTVHDTAASPLAYEKRQSRAAPAYAMIWLHGLGADGHDFIPVTQAMPQSGAHGIEYYFPHAPLRPVTINNGMVMRAWYDILGVELRRDLDSAGIKASVAAVEALRDAIAAQGIPHERHILAGFSQGGVIALRTALASEQPVAAVIGLSCYLAQSEELTTWASQAAASTPVFLGHGDHDPMVACQLGQAARDTLTAAGYAVAWRHYPIPHSVSPAEIADLDQWLADILGAQATS
ncbi:MAG: alpha/beta hydrolase [Wenzhouxiangellaceae bacterium]